MFTPFRFESFHSVWYWVLIVAVWIFVSNRTLGVPFDMIQRARRIPEVGLRIDTLAHIAAERAEALYAAIGVPVAAVAGFFLAVLAAAGFGSGVQLAQAVFLILLPLALVTEANVRLARHIRTTGLTGRFLRRALARRRFWNQVIAIGSILATTLMALVNDLRLEGLL